LVATILSLISGLFALAGKIFDYLYARQMVDAGKTAQQLSDLKGEIDAAHKAVLARLDVERDSLNKPGSVSVDDGFQRPD
jgi:hypothetical protein